MKRLIIILALISTLATFGQGLTDNMTIGLNLLPLIGNTIDIKIEKHPKPHWTYQLAIGCMYNNELIGSYYKKSDGSFNRENSGVFSSIGLRFNTRKEENKSTFFIGSKLIFGYFIQYADNNLNDVPPKRTGVFAAVGLETGATIRVTEKFFIDLGFQYSPPFYSDRQASMFSVLPGIGAIGDLQGIFVLKYSLHNKDK